MTTRNWIAVVLAAAMTIHGECNAFAGDPAVSAALAPLVVHEWGTFTTLQDETGRLLTGINIDDEPLPDFVGRVKWIVGDSGAAQKGISRGDSDVNMRLETPVMYFYPPAGSKTPITLDVEASFPGGWLTEFYPVGESTATGLQKVAPGVLLIGKLKPDSLGTLTWRKVTLNATDAATPPKTDSHVWTAPRGVTDSASVTVDGQTERYLFYRGVANVKQPANPVGLLSQEQLVTARIGEWFPRLWLVDVRDDGTVAFITTDVSTRDLRQFFLRSPIRVLTEPHTKERLRDLRNDMVAALIHDGLFESEANAMLDTWEAAYFKSPGLRLFSTVPPGETDRMLPLKFSVPVKVTRVMIRRDEIVTPRQRDLIKRIAAGPASDYEWLKKLASARPEAEAAKVYRQLSEGRAPLSDSATAPADYQAYAALGRFRNPLLLDELERHPTPALAHFIENYYIRYSTPGQ